MKTSYNLTPAGKSERDEKRRGARQVGKENESRRKTSRRRLAERKKKRKVSNWPPPSITSPLSLIIAASQKQAKQTTSGLMYSPVTTARLEPNGCFQSEMYFWKTPVVNTPLCMADSSFGLSPSLTPPHPYLSVLLHFPSHYFKVKRVCEDENVLLTHFLLVWYLRHNKWHMANSSTSSFC